MDKKKILYTAGIAALIYIVMGTRKVFGKLTDSNKIRPADEWGSGAFGASRNGRKHEGVDIVVYPGQELKSPVSGTVKRIAYPYADDLSYKGFVLVSGPYVITVYYANLSVPAGSSIAKGQVIATAQDISARYDSGMKPHVHFEVKKNGVLIDPTNLFE